MMGSRARGCESLVSGLERQTCEIEPLVLFVLQFAWFLFAWSLIAYFVLWPWSARLPFRARLSAWIAPEMFRVLGVGLLVPNLSPGMPIEFAAATAAGDSTTALLAALAFTGLRRGWASARGLAWACTIVHRRLARRPDRLPSRCRHGGHLTHGGAVVCPGVRGSASRALSRGVLHPAHRLICSSARIVRPEVSNPVVVTAFTPRFEKECREPIAALPDWFGIPADSNAANRRNLAALPSWGLNVKTLAPSHPDPYHARTRAFYQAMGFGPLFETAALWGPENPSAVLVKAL
jgi:hypothetical protein